MNQPQEKPRLGVVRENPQQRLRILVVNDDDVVSSVLRSGFEPVGIVSLKIVPNAETAIRVLSTEAYDLLAVDPAISSGGFELLKHVKDHYRWTATLLATHNQDPQFLRRAVKCRIDGLLFRPTTSTEFVEQALLLAKAVNGRRRRQQKRVLAIGAHPDDVEIGCGGALAKHHADRDVLHILTLSRGAVGGDVNIRVVEAHNAAALVGARLEMANLRDTGITEGAETISIIEAAIRELNATDVYTHSLEDTHQDHRAVHAASLVAARGVPNVYCYQSPSSTVEFKPHRFVDITHYIEKKIDLIGAYKSQVDRMESIQPDIIVSTARYWGRFAGYVLAEPLRIVRQRDSDDPALDLPEAQEEEPARPQPASVAESGG
jgi:LmbE family N-acetylglucosaminyl deacetylase